MAKITVQVRNNTSDDKIAKVIDRFAGGNREVDGSPFPLAGGEVSPSFGVNVGSDGIGKVDYQFEGGGYNAGEEIEDGKVLDLD